MKRISRYLLIVFLLIPSFSSAQTVFNQNQIVVPPFLNGGIPYATSSAGNAKFGVISTTTLRALLNVLDPYAFSTTTINGVLGPTFTFDTTGTGAPAFTYSTTTGTVTLDVSTSTLQSILSGTSSQLWLANGNNIYNANAGNVLIGSSTANATHSLTFPNTSTGIALYNTADQTTNFDRGQIDWNSNVFRITTTSGGTGSNRNIQVSTALNSGRAMTLVAGTPSTGLIKFNPSLGANTSAAINALFEGTFAGTNLIQRIVEVAPTISQSSTAGYTALLINPTESSTGSGARRLIDAQVGGTSRFVVESGGNVGIGTTTPQSKLTVNGNIDIGTTTTSAAGQLTQNGVRLMHTYGSVGSTPNLFIGQGAGNFTLQVGTSTENVAVGGSALSSLTSGVGNVALGNEAGRAVTTGSWNMLLGRYAGRALTTAGSNMAIGRSSMFQNVSSGGNTAVGDVGLFSLTSGSGLNTAIGFQPLFDLVSGANNVAIGAAAGNGLTGADSNNTFIGTNADALIAGLKNATALGYNAKVGASNSLVLGGTGAFAVNVGIGTTSPNARLSVVASTTLPNATVFNVSSSTGSSLFGIDGYGSVWLSGSEGSAGQVLTSAGTNAPAYWSAVAGGSGATSTINGVLGPTFTLDSSNPAFTYSTSSQTVTLNVSTSTLSSQFPGGIGSVTSVGATVPAGLTISGSPVTTSGVLAIGLDPLYTIPLVASTTQWDAAYASTTILTNPYIRGLFSASAPLSYDSGTGAFSIAQSGAGTDGYLSSTDWNTFNNKQAAGSYITALTGDVTASGPGSVAATLATVNADVGSFGGSTAIPNFTVNAKGLMTAAGTSAVIAPAGTLTGTTLAANVVSSSLTSVGTIATGVWNGTAVGPTFGGTGLTSYATGDLLYGSASNVLSSRTIGTTGDVLSVVGGLPTWVATSTLGISGGGTITLSGDVSGSGTSAITTTIGALKVVGSMIANATIDLATKVTGILAVANGGTSFASYSIGDMLYASGSGALSKLGIGSTGQVLTVAGGVPTWATSSAPSTVKFRAVNPTDQAASALTKVIFANESYDTGSNFATTTSIYTVPSTGYYQVDARIGISGGTSNDVVHTGYVYVNGAATSTGDSFTSNSGDNVTVQLSDVFYLKANDTVEIYADGGGVSSNILGGSTRTTINIRQVP